MPFSGRIKLKISKVYRMKSIKSINFFFSFILFFKNNMPQGIATVKNEKKKKRRKKKKEID